MLVEGALEREALPADLTAERLVVEYGPGCGTPTGPSACASSLKNLHTRRDSHVEPHVPVKTSLLVEGLAAVDADQPLVVWYQWPRALLSGGCSRSPGYCHTGLAVGTLHQALQITVQVDGQGPLLAEPVLLEQLSMDLEGLEFSKLPGASDTPPAACEAAWQ